MVRSNRLKPIKKLAQNKEQQAARALGDTLEKQKQEGEKLQTLQQYRAEYLQTMEQRISAGTSGAVLQQFHVFLKKLDHAITQQHQVLNDCQTQIKTAQKQWRGDHSRRKAISQAMDNMKGKEDQKRDKDEAKQTDEISTQAFLKRQKSTLF